MELKMELKTGWETKFGGLTKREHIATQVLAGLSANYLRDNVTGWDIKAYVKEAVSLTDALLEELSIESLPKDNFCKVCNLPTDGEKCYSKRCPV